MTRPSEKTRLIFCESKTRLMDISSKDSRYSFTYLIGSFFKLQTYFSPKSAALEPLNKNIEVTIQFGLRFIKNQWVSLTSTYELPLYPDNGKPKTCNCIQTKENNSSRSFINNCSLISIAFQIWFLDNPIWISVYHVLVPVGLTTART